MFSKKWKYTLDVISFINQEDEGIKIILKKFQENL